MPTPRTRPDIQYRTAEVTDTGAGFSGYASNFRSVDSYLTAVADGAFRKTIKERGAKTPVLWQHNPDWPIGRPTELKEDKIGLRFDAQISEGTTYGRDAMTLLRDGVPLGMSFGFQTIRSRPATKEDDLDYSQFKAKPEQVTIIEEVKLWEISLVTFPANELATVNDVRAVAEADALHSLLEELKAGTLTPEDARWSALHTLVAAYQERAAAGAVTTATTAPDPEQARRRTRTAQIALAQLRADGLIGAQA